MKQRIYIDTSVWGGVFDKEFEHETALLFDMVKTMQMICPYSDITEKELIKAPQNVIFNKHGIVGQWSECKSAVV